MKATGIVRRLDALGRITIPKEIRKTLQIKPGTPLEIFTDVDGSLTFRKYSLHDEYRSVAEDCAKSLRLNFGCVVLITDGEEVIAGSGAGELIGAPISEDLKALFQQAWETVSLRASGIGCINAIPYTNLETHSQIVAPIRIGRQDGISGAVILLHTSGKVPLSTAAEASALCIAAFLGSQLSKNQL